MASVKSRNNKSTEQKFILFLKQREITGWRRNYPLMGKPDFVFRKQKVAIFIDGCFWHGCPKHCRMPSSRTEYWNAKIARNKQRDKFVTRFLREKGWLVIRIWEHEIREEKLDKKLTFLFVSSSNKGETNASLK